MFDIGWPEVLVIATVLIIVVGPKDLPPMLRAFGRTTKKMRAMANEFRGQFDEALREAELGDVKKTFDDARRLNPLNTIRDAINPLKATGAEIKADLERTVSPPTLKPDPSAPPAIADAPVAPPKFELPVPMMKLADGPPSLPAPVAPVVSAAAATVPAGKPRKPASTAGAKAHKPTAELVGQAAGKTIKVSAAPEPAAPKAAKKTKDKS